MDYKHLLFKDNRATRDYMRDKRAGTLNGRRWKDYAEQYAKKDYPAPKDQTPTHARKIEDMNEAQLDREIAKFQRWVDAEEREVNRIQNSASIKNAEQIFEMFPGGVGGSAVNSRYRKTMDRFGNALNKLTEAQNKYNRNKERLDALKETKKKIHGTGKTLRTVATATASKGNGEWKPTTFSVYGDSVKGKEMGDYVAAKPFYTYNLYDKRTGNKIRTFKTFKALDAWVRKNG